MTKIILKYASGKSIILLFGFVLFFNFIVFPISHKANTKLTVLDLQISYSPEQAYDILAKYSKNERRNYLIGELTVDLIYPAIYTLLLCFSIFMLYGKMNLAKLPILILISDYAENFGIVTIIYNYPKHLTNIARITSIFTTIKWFLVVISIIIIIYGLWIKRNALFFKKNKDER